MSILDGVQTARTEWYCNHCGIKRNVLEEDIDPNQKIYRCVDCRYNVCLNCIDLKQGKAILFCKLCKRERGI